MTTEPVQTIATPPARFPSLGFSKRMPCPLDRCFGLVIGEQNSGKSHLFQSNPDAFILNIDEISTVGTNPRACIWPGIDADGRSIDVDGKPLTLTWDHVAAKVKDLIALAKSGSPRPTLVAIDTLYPLIRLLKPTIAKLYSRTAFEECDGRQAWPRLYQTLIDELAYPLRQAGYGVWFIAHISRQWIKLDENKNVQDLSIGLPSGLVEFLMRTVEVCAPVVSRAESVTTTKVVETPVKIGNQITMTKNKVSESVLAVRHRIAFADPDYHSLSRFKTARPPQDVDLDVPDPWSAFRDAYTAAQV